MFGQFRADGDEEVSGRERDGFLICLDRIPSRNSPLSCSSRFYYRNAVGVPFQWEMQPGTPKNPPLKEAIPPLSPPPALLSLGLPKPFMEQPNPKSQTKRMLLGLWRKYSRSNKNEENMKVKRYCLDKFEQRIGFCSSDCDFMESPCKSSSSFSCTSSSSISFSNDPPSPSVAGVVAGSSRDSSDQWRRLGCAPWNINTIKVAIGRRV